MDVVELVRELGTRTVRYPGGNFVSGFRWEDSVGPRDRRPVRRDLAWHSLESNQVGLDEFARWLKLTDSEMMLAVNLGRRGILPALDLLEYANHPSGTALSDLRVANGTLEPHNIRMWCLGNEMDGPWQTGFMTADDYGKLAARTAGAMKMADKDLELVVCGSSNSGMPTFGDWERRVLDHAYDHVDYVSCHAYYQEHDGDLGSFLASATDLDYFIDTVVATADHVGYKRRSNKKINISFDEWNVWYQKEHPSAATHRNHGTVLPRRLRRHEHAAPVDARREGRTGLPQSARVSRGGHGLISVRAGRCPRTPVQDLRWWATERRSGSWLAATVDRAPPFLIRHQVPQRDQPA